MNSCTRHRATALFFALDQARVEVIELLLERGAQVNARDTFYSFHPLASQTA